MTVAVPKLINAPGNSFYKLASSSNFLKRMLHVEEDKSSVCGSDMSPAYKGMNCLAHFVFVEASIPPFFVINEDIGVILGHEI